MVVTLLGLDGEGGTPELPDLQEWADTFGLTFPVLADPNGTVGMNYEEDYGIPSMHLLGTGAVVLIRDGTVTDADIEDALPD